MLLLFIYLFILFINSSRVMVKVMVRVGVSSLCGITMANGLSYVVSTEYKNMMWCTF